MPRNSLYIGISLVKPLAVAISNILDDFYYPDKGVKKIRFGVKKIIIFLPHEAWIFSPHAFFYPMRYGIFLLVIL